MDEQLQQNREAWLYRAALFLFEHMQRCGLSPVPVRVSCGWPVSGGGGQKNVTIGQCFAPTVCADGVSQVFISPRIADSVEVLGVLLHELIHASFGNKFGHKKPFSQAAKKVGLAGPPTATVVGPELLPLLQDYVSRVGTYPHAAIVPMVKEKTPGSRLRLYECTCDPPIKVRVASDELDASCNRCGASFSKVEKAE
ncbi:hypothetical protein [Dictyobacter aurantiacus]|uniref:SprT-like domain-containing protein n=1 Tax=Dictyobacter aurantiacus TaxID=1936993 RepID=A0A401ZFD8_9CHLR|nr:hypothetical protein [Dictyobacter aurantiacus]GCE05600.1 hypothetical protein KDAU_29290 [Dictyobacter aurantiacus]